MHGLTNDVTGQRFGKLVVKSATHRNGSNRLEWVCDCDCGGSTTIRSNRLVSGKTKSCGCLQRQTRLLSGSLGSFRQWLRSYKQGAAKRNLPFKLKEVQFLLLTSMDCYYCGNSPVPHYGAGRKDIPIPYIGNGIDRLDNEKGYSFENCVPCCSMCNTMKLDFNERDFIAKCRVIADRGF